MTSTAVIPTFAPPRLKDRDAGRSARRQVPIIAMVGPNGGGKSLAMVLDTLPSLRAGRRVLSTLELIDPRTGQPYPNYERLEDWQQIIEARNCDVLFDEVMGIANSRESAGLPWQVQNILGQLRRRDVVLRWSAPAWARADKINREVTQAVTVCTGHMSAGQPRSEDGSPEVRLWRERRLFIWKTYEKPAEPDWSPEKAREILPLKKAFFRRPGSEAMHSYRTLDDVSTISDLASTGHCVKCKGRRVVPICKCPPEDR